jgi:hypothetical protein
MIIADKIDGLEAYCQENRKDKDSKIPYFIADEVNDEFVLPEDSLIEAGFKELKLPYSLVIEIRGKTIELESAIFDEK